ncbi:hypothetical protein [[Clostridium] fimetarium]|uniref:Uncharacterized protein n=1 Tax=[Clostridium] fimetarium TaxID=99656 RepID=A0A1I0MV41_9FIRM|nr:hypothetical protein [[Clostridium] fimetarium]SEV92420.1 hypothetical protein SAMN05421659_102161 [[Clostridium] fimetarium]
MMDIEKRTSVLKVLQDVQKMFFDESESKWYKYLDQAIEELEYAKE